MFKWFNLLAYIIGYLMFWMLIILILLLLVACTPVVEYKDVYIPQKCQTEVPPSIECKVDNKDYKGISECMVNNQKRTELLETRLKYCIGEGKTEVQK